MKRTLDVLTSLLFIVLFSPVYLIISVLVFMFIGKPIIFKQNRPGKHGGIFKLYKFRSMNNRTDSEGVLLPNEKRLTAFGKILRASSLDELPQLYNVLKGDMSLVGPRPLLVEYLELYDTHQVKRHDVRPGITGWAQVNGRNALSWEEKFELDVWYVENRNFLLDIKILFMTFMKVIKSKDVNKSTTVIVKRFEGNNKQTGQNID